MLDIALREIFARAFRCEIPEGNFAATDLREWDSLTHIKLVMELELAYALSIGPDEIPALYTDYETVKSFVSNSGAS